MILLLLAMIYVVGLCVVCVLDEIAAIDLPDIQIVFWPITLITVVPIRAWKYWSKVVRDELKR